MEGSENVSANLKMSEII